MSYETVTIAKRARPMDDMFVLRNVRIPQIAERVRAQAGIVVPFLLFSLIVPLVSFALLSGSTTQSLYTAGKDAPENALLAAAVDFTVATDTEATLSPGDSAGLSLSVTPGSGSIPFTYHVSASVAAGSDPAFCAALSASGGIPLPYSGPLASLVSADTEVTGAWPLTVSFPDAGTVGDGATCVIDLAFAGFQEGGAPDTEFHDTEHVRLTLHANVPPQTIVIDSLAAPEPLSPEDGAATDTPPLLPAGTTTPPGPGDDAFQATDTPAEGQ